MAARASSSRASAAAPRNDAYTGLLLISLLAQIVGVVFFFLDWQSYPTTKPALPPPPTLSSAAPAGGVAPVPAPAP